MSMDPQKFNTIIEEMRAMQDMVENRIVEKEVFVKFVKSFINAWSKLRVAVNDSLSAVETKVSASLSDVERNMKKETEETKKLVRDTSDTTNKNVQAIESDLKQLKNAVQDIKNSIPTVDFSDIEKKINALEKRIPTVKTLPEVWRAFDDVRDELEKVRKEKQRAPLVQFGTPNALMVFSDIDISDQLDGVTTTFNLPAMWNLITVSLSSFPYGALRKGVDYTWTPTSVTFLSTIDPATQLAAGQSCILTVVHQ